MPEKSLRISCVQMQWADRLEKNLQVILGRIREGAERGSRVILFPETAITGYHFPYVIKLSPKAVDDALDKVCRATRESGLWVIVGTIRRTGQGYLNLAHVIDPRGRIVHEYAKVQLAGNNERKYCRPGNKLSFFRIDGIPCTLVICRDGRHPELYRIPVVAGARIVFQPSCSSDTVEAVAWKRESGRAQQPAGPNSFVYHCVANTVGQSPDGLEASSGWSYIKDPTGLSLAEAGFYDEGIITAIVNPARATRFYALQSANHPRFLKRYWREMVKEVKARADDPVR